MIANMAHNPSRLANMLRIITAIIFTAAGANHFIHAAFYQRMIPPGFPSPPMLVFISGICEIAGGIGLLVSSLRPWAGWGLIALLLAVFPANVYMAIHSERFTDLHLPAWCYLLRLPLQPLAMGWLWWVSIVR